MIVSGLPRSGTSMMMAMLDAGGIPPLTDHVRSADEDNPKGYFEFERVKKIKSDRSWLNDTENKVVKMISMLLSDLPATNYQYKIIFMERDLDEVLASQKKMLARRGEKGGPEDDEKMAVYFKDHLAKTKRFLNQRRDCDVLYINHREVIASPEESARQVAAFLEKEMDTHKMAKVVDTNLYRNRAK